jgi:cyclopropane-fatty-acyl-phospholipid synthase
MTANGLACALLRGRFERLFQSVGASLDGAQPWDPQVKHPRFFARVALGGTLGAGESYVDGDWDCQALDELTKRILRRGVERRFGVQSMELVEAMRARVLNRQSRSRALRASHIHYDRGNDLYRSMLGPSMACGYRRCGS